MLLLMFLITVVFTPYSFCNTPAYDLALKHACQIIISPLPLEHLTACKARSAAIAQRTKYVQANLLSAEEVLKTEGFLPPTLSQYKPAPLKCFKNIGLDAVQTLFALLLIADEQRFAPPTDPPPLSLPQEAQNLLLRCLLIIQSIYHQTHLKVNFFWQEDKEPSMLDEAIMTSLGSLVIALPRALIRADKTFAIILKKKVCHQFKQIFKLETVGSALCAEPTRSFWAEIYIKIFTYLGYEPMPFDQKTPEPFLQKYSKHLLQYIKTTSPSQTLTPPNTPDEDVLWKTALIHTFLQGKTHIFFDQHVTPAPCFHLSIPEPLQKWAHTLGQKIIQTTYDTLLYTDPKTFLPPTKSLQSMHEEFKSVWYQQSRDDPTFNEDCAVDHALITVQDMITPTSQPQHLTPTAFSDIYCILSNTPLFELCSIEAGLLILFPSPETLANTPELSQNIHLVASHTAIRAALKLHKQSPPTNPDYSSVVSWFNLKRERHIITEYSNLYDNPATPTPARYNQGLKDNKKASS